MTDAGNCNPEVADAYFEPVLSPVLPPGDVIELDNARFQHSPSTAALVAAADLNSVEHLWAVIKASLRKSLALAANPGLFVGNTYLVYC
ncbi:MAG: hypothetical protein WCS94_23440 [Verrucomicrobiota bacterium]